MKPYKKNDTHPLAINVLKLNRYNYDFFNCEEVVFFEYIIVKGMAFKKHQEFFHSSKTIRNETGIKKHSLKSIISKFESLGIISTQIKGMPRVKYFTVHYPIIVSLFPQIYKLINNGKLQADFGNHLADFFIPLVDNYSEKNNIKNTKEEVLKEKEDIESEHGIALTSFYDFLTTLKYKNNITQASLKFDETALFRALNKYDVEQLCSFIELYFKVNSNATLKKFFVFDTYSPNRIVFIEKKVADDFNYGTVFIDQLQSTYLSRIDMHNKDKSKKRGKSESKLVVTARIIEKVIEALRVKSELEINNAFMPYIDAIINDQLEIKKILPYFFSVKDGEYEIIDTYLEYYNIKYGYTKNNKH
jgi:hypothetical protein